MRRINKDAPKRKTLLLGLLLIAIPAIILTASIANYRTVRSELNAQQVKVKTYQTETKQLNTQLYKAKTQEVNDQKDKASSQQQIQQLQQDKTNLQQQLQAKAEVKSKLTLVADAVKSVVSPVAYADGCGDNQYSSYIYSHESGCSTNITNSEGCIGIGQACPASKLIAACPSLDYACENTFFTTYAVARYGSWEGAYNAWLSQHWW